MSMRVWARTAPMRVALAVLVVGVALMIWTFVKAFRVDEIPDPPPTTMASLEAITRSTVRPTTDIEAAVENDVFAADRSPPAAPYRMPGDPDPNAKPVIQPDKPLVLGTVVATDGRSFATVTLGDTRAKIVRVGDRIGEWVVKSIERGKVVLVGVTTGTRVDVTVPKPGF
jgi:hypothetical protein